MGGDRYSQDDLDALRRTRTVFFLPRSEMVDRATYEDALTKVWTFTPLIVAPFEEYDTYQRSGYSHFILKGVLAKDGQGFILTGDLHMTLRLPAFEDDGKGGFKDRSIDFCRIEVFAEHPTRHMLYEKEGAIDRIYERGRMLNWTPGMMMIYLGEVQRDLERGRRARSMDKECDESAMDLALAGELLIPDYVLQYGETPENSDDPSAEHIMQNYPHRYRILTADELSDLLLSTDRAFVLDYVRGEENKVISVYSVPRVGLIYKEFDRAEPEFKPSDMKKVCR